MDNQAADTASEPDIDPALVAAMESRVVVRKPQPYGNRKPGPGRPKGSTKTGGKKAGTPNLMTPEFRQWLSDRAKPFEVLAAICNGEAIEDAGTMRKPTIPERMRAAETLARKLLPDLAATALTGANAAPLIPSAVDMSPFEVARRVAFLLASGLDAETDASQPPQGPLAPQRARISTARIDPEFARSRGGKLGPRLAFFAKTISGNPPRK